MRRICITLIYIALFIPSILAQMKSSADLILINGKIYTVDLSFSIKEAIAVKSGRIIATGATGEILSRFESGRIIDAGGKAVYPGFIDAHSHFYGYALSLVWADLRGAHSMNEVLEILKKKSGDHPSQWLTGRGWDQNLWTPQIFPDRSGLDSLFPDRPVVLIRIDGHVVLANGEALRRAGITGSSGFLPGEVEIKDGRMTGILSENAADKVKNAIPEGTAADITFLLKKAEKNCFEAGLTCVCDAGEELRIIRLYDSLQKQKEIAIKLYVMLSPTDENIDHYLKKGVYETPSLNVRSVKLYADGSLGSRTALLKSPYSDAPDKSGIMVTTEEKFREICTLAYRHGYQVNTHAIGDSAVKLVLGIYSEFLKGKNDLRWRVEHAQVVDPRDLHLFGEYSVIPSVQATHATSDMYWAGERLGPQRIRWAYAYRALMDQNGWLANGTDFPIENISPVMTFYASVARKDLKGFPDKGFQVVNALSREEALRSITIWAAKAEFVENDRGSLEPGKSADFVILDKDLMAIPEDEIPSVKILQTYLNGKEVFRK